MEAQNSVKKLFSDIFFPGLKLLFPLSHKSYDRAYAQVMPTKFEAARH